MWGKVEINATNSSFIYKLKGGIILNNNRLNKIYKTNQIYLNKF